MTITVSQPRTKCRQQQQPLQSLWRKISTMVEVSRQRRTLKALDARLLGDIGITRADATREAEKPVWDVPSHWLK